MARQGFMELSKEAAKIFLSSETYESGMRFDGLGGVSPMLRHIWSNYLMSASGIHWYCCTLVEVALCLKERSRKGLS